jgi:hypothetical protein
MRIPNKFNGYSADNRRIYNDPTLVVATIANMGEGAAAAASIAEATAAAAAASEAAAAAAAEQTAAAAAQQAGQARIMQGASVPPPGVTPPGAPGFGAPVAPAQPLPPAGGTPFTPPTAPPPVDPVQAQLEQLANRPPNEFLNKTFEPLADVGPSQLVEKAPTFDPTKLDAGAQYSQYADAANGIKTTVSAEPVVKNAFLDGVRNAYEAVSKTAGDAYKEFQKAPPALQYLSAGLAAKKYLVEEPKGPKKEEYKRTPYDGLSPTFAATETGEYKAPGGASPYLYGFADGGPVEQMSNMNAGIMPTTGQNNMYPMSQQKPLAYANPAIQNPISQNVIDVGASNRLDAYTGMPTFAEGGYAEDKKTAEEATQRKRYAQMLSGKSGSDLENDIAQGQAIAARAKGSNVGIIPRSRAQSLGTPSATAQTELNAMFKSKGMKSYLPKMLDPQSASAGAGETDFAANGGIMHGLGGYSDGGRLLKGPGDGVSDSIPATIGNRQPARLADGEFVIPARIVSELGNGSTEAGARQLYAMMERIQKNRKKSVGKGKVAVDSKAAKHLPA